jgi:hypothetical protein
MAKGGELDFTEHATPQIEAVSGDGIEVTVPTTSTPKPEVAPPLAVAASPIGSLSRKKKAAPSEMDMEVHQSVASTAANTAASTAASPNASIPITMATSSIGTGTVTGSGTTVLGADAGSAPSLPLPPPAGSPANEFDKTVLPQELVKLASLTGTDMIDLESNGSDPSKASKVVQEEGSKKEQVPSTWNRRRLMIRLLIALVIVGGAVGIAIWLTSDSSSDEKNTLPSNVILDITKAKPGTVADVPEDLCNEWVPGQGMSKVCTVAASSNKGGQVGNLVATSFLEGTSMLGSDMAIINAGLVKQDIVSPKVTVGDVMGLVEDDYLVIVDMSGASIRKVLEDAIESAIGKDEKRGKTPLDSAYPYAAGLLFAVDSTKTFGSRVSGVKVPSELTGGFININEGAYYKVITTAYLAAGGDEYKAFGAIVDEWKTELPQSTINTFYTLVESMDELTFDGIAYSTVSFVAPDYDPGVALVPTNVCLEWTPGGGKSEICPPEETIVQGGGVCNLVAWTFLDQNFRAEVALIRAGDYASDIRQGTFRASDSEAIFPVDYPLVTMKVTGQMLQGILETALVGALDRFDPRPEAYPYAAGIRFNVDAAAGFGLRTSNVEFFKNTRWVPLEEDRLYTVVTTQNLAKGEDPAYQGLLYGDSQGTGSLSAAETFLAFATEWAVLFDPPRDKYSTQLYSSG